ncbi:MAG: hypothetical protein D6675_01260 [Gemmatimonadetes bacterium]|nr:MAG: hypothetical protein D6675_01260 [Gemmatimonadota bacterium]
MKAMIGIRREDKNQWERRVPLVPAHVKSLIEEDEIEVWVQPSSIRVFTDDEYRAVGAKVHEDLSLCPVIFAVKEIPMYMFEPHKTYVFFSHTIKGQDYNMPMLKKMMSLKCNLIDYEKITDDQGRRLIFFGKYAGLAGMVETLWTLGKRLAWESIANPFETVKHAYEYPTLADAKAAIAGVGAVIRDQGFDKKLAPFVIGFAGYGNVSQGAQEILEGLPVIEVRPDELAEVYARAKEDTHHVYKVVFYEHDLVEPKVAGVSFDLQDYYQHPEKYRSKFEPYVPYLTVLINGIYWTEDYPRLLSKDFVRELYSDKETPTLRVVGDISCDIEGSIECTTHATKPDKPAFVYNPFDGWSTDGYEGVGLVMMAVDNLPCELPRESSTAFSEGLKPFVKAIATADFSGPFEECNLPPEIRRAVILYQGELTPDYKYMEAFL